MPQQVVHYRQIGIRGPKDSALRRIVLPGSLGVWQTWRTAKPSGIHIAMKRGLLIGRLVVHSYYWPTKPNASTRAAPSAPGAATRRHYRTEVRSLSQTITHGGAVFTIGRLGR